MSSPPEGATTPARIATLARLPVFLALAGKDVEPPLSCKRDTE